VPELIYPTRTQVVGPILIDTSSLMDLDKIIAEQRETLIALRSKLIEQSMAERVAELGSVTAEDLKKKKELWQPYFEGRAPEYSTKVTLYLSDGSRLKAKSFAEAAAHSEFSQVPASGFELSTVCGAISLTLVAETDAYSTLMRLDVSPSSAEGATNLFSEVRRWLRKVQAPRSQQWWCKLGHNRFFLWMGWAFVAFFMTISALGGLGDGYYRRQGRELVRQGVNGANQQKAIETMLALQTEMSGPVQQSPKRRFWFFLFGSFLVCLMLSYPPKLVIGLGVGEDKIKRWKSWTNFVFLVVPGFVASNFLWPFVSDTLKKLW
jgi:hypothetical protein